MNDTPYAHDAMLNALEDYLDTPTIIILRGRGAALAQWHRQLLSGYHPRRTVLAIDADATGLPPALADKAPLADVVAYVCEGLQCSAPITSLQALSDFLARSRHVDSIHLER